MHMELRQRLESSTRLSRHRHDRACVAVVIDGGYFEAGDEGRWLTQPGDVLVYQRFTSHLNHIPRLSSVLNLSLPSDILHLRARYRVRDVDELVVVAERDRLEATGLLLERLLPGRPQFDDAIDRLASRLADLDTPRVQVLADQLGVRRETLFRQFRSIYGTSPTRYRTETRARRAWLETVTAATPLASLAFDLGFADQAHMSRCVCALTGMTPRQWRATFVQDHGRAAC